MQSKAITVAFTKPNQQVVTFFLKTLTRGDTASSENGNFQSYTQQYAVAEQTICNETQVQVPKHTKPKLLKPVVRFSPTLNITMELIKPELLL